MRYCIRFLLSWLLVLQGLYAVGQSFDLTGPKVDVHVKRGDVTLPIGQVPNLMPGDRLWIHPDFPDSQSAHYVLIVAFLRGATNPPPPEWFSHMESWNNEVRSEGVFVTVPAEAQQALIFLAPETGGDFSTLRSTVRGRPGVFVRATQDLQAASWDRMRLDAFLADVKVTSQTDPKALKERTEASARSLGIQLNQQCFDKPTDQQAPCLVQHTNGLVMDDTAGQTRVDQLTSGSAGDLMNQLMYSPMVGASAYSPYIGAIVDTAKILASLHTAHFQYIPALALPTADTLNLRLDSPPSFRDPKSVVVVALPPVSPAKMPPLHPINPAEVFCAQKPGLVLPAEGAPLVLATQLAHNLSLHIETKAGGIDLPVKADPAQGGLVLEHADSRVPGGDLTGVIRGKWGFDEWEGPHYRLHAAQSGKWSVAASDQSALVVGRDDTLHVEGESTLCVESVKIQHSTGSPLSLTWKSPKPEALDVTVPLKDATPGPVTLEIRQYGLEKPDSLTLKAYAEAASLDRLTLSAGDLEAVLTGTRLDEVAKASLDGITWTPTALSRVQESDRLAMKADKSTGNLEPGKRYFASVELADGRQLRARVTVDPSRPQVSLLSKGTQDEASAASSPVHLGSPDDLPVERRLVFFLKSKTPVNFPRNETVDVAATDGSFHTVLSLANGTLMLEDAKTVLGVVEPLARFGSSAFGPIEARAISADGVTGDWLPLGTLVRLPGFKELHCPRAPAKPCTLTGSNLFLAASIAATTEFDNATDVPPDFTGTQLSVPHPANGVLFFKLRDDPGAVQTLALPLMPMNSGSPSATVPPEKEVPSTAPPEPQPAPSSAPPSASQPLPSVQESQPSAAPSDPKSAPQSAVQTLPGNTAPAGAAAGEAPKVTVPDAPKP